MTTTPGPSTTKGQTPPREFRETYARARATPAGGRGLPDRDEVLGAAGREQASEATDAVLEWDAAFEVGQPVRYWTGFREGPLVDAPKFGRTRTPAQLLGGHTAVVWVSGESSCVALSHVDPITEEELEEHADDAPPDARDVETPAGTPVELAATLHATVTGLDAFIQQKAREVAAPAIAAAEMRAAAAERRAEEAERAVEQRLEDLRAEMVRQRGVVERKYWRVWWLAQYVPAPLRDLVAPIPDSVAANLPEEWRDMTARRAGPVDAVPAAVPAGEDRRLLEEGIVMVVERQSAADFQRRMRVGFATAQRLLDRMEELGVVGPPRPGRARLVLAAREELPAVWARLDAAGEGSTP